MSREHRGTGNRKHHIGTVQIVLSIYELLGSGKYDFVALNCISEWTVVDGIEGFTLKTDYAIPDIFEVSKHYSHSNLPYHALYVVSGLELCLTWQST